jgi:hypothetical protein
VFDLREFLNLNNKQKQQSAPPAPASTAQPQRSSISRVFDQVNPLDNGRTYKQANPVKQESIWQQAVHSNNPIVNPINFASNEIVKPLGTGFVNTAKLVPQTGSALAKNIDPFNNFSNQQANQSLNTLRNTYHNSIPGGMLDSKDWKRYKPNTNRC